mgnify:CR=1 FL=1
MTHNELKEKYIKGEILIGIEPSIARQFFTDLDAETVKQNTGEYFAIERLKVKIVWLLQFAFVLAAIVTSIFAIKWYSLIYIPIIFISWFYYMGRASIGNQSMLYVTLLVLLSFILSFIFKDKEIIFIVWLILTSLPFYFARLTYKLSTIYFRAIVLKNESIFNMYFTTGFWIKIL